MVREIRAAKGNDVSVGVTEDAYVRRTVTESYGPDNISGGGDPAECVEEIDLRSDGSGPGRGRVKMSHYVTINWKCHSFLWVDILLITGPS